MERSIILNVAYLKNILDDDNHKMRDTIGKLFDSDPIF